MIGFKRTLGGLNNQHLFYNVDFVIYLEGGKISFNNKEQVYEENCSSETLDIIFWRYIFKHFKSEKKIKFKSIGSKFLIKEIANDIITGNISSVYVGMDNEFDEILNKRITHPNVLYTYGYSWENDVWNIETIKSLIENFTAIEIENDEIENNYNEFLSKVTIAVYADAYLFKSNSSFFPRNQGYLFCVDCKPKDLPIILENEIKSKMVEKCITKRQISLYGKKHSINPQKYCFGHFLADYCCQLIIHYIKKRHLISNLPKDIIYRMSIKQYFENYFETSHTFQFYKDQIQ